MNLFRTILLKYFKQADLRGCIRFIEEKETLIFGSQTDVCVELMIKDLRFYKKIIINGDIGLGEAYFLGYFECSDLRALFEWFIRNKDELPGFNSRKRSFVLFEWGATLLRLYHRLNKNTKRGSRRNIKYHYDVSNDFYKLWLDKTMTYSSAVFKEGMDLEQAQENKYRIICEQIELGSKDHVLEIGSGWGGFSIFAAKNYGAKITTITISEKQFRMAKKRIEEAGLGGQIDIKLLDYRDLDGEYDKIVSIEMMEALGHQYLRGFIKACDKALKPGGKILFQCITYPDEKYEEYLKNNNYIKKYIFPGGELISFTQLERLIEGIEGLSIKNIRHIGFDYAKTLRKWANNFQDVKKEILELGFDERFFLMWYYYFIYCEAGFATSYLDDLQIKIEKV